MTIFVYHIGTIVLRSTSKKVIRINAGPIITVMQDPHPFRDFTEVQLP